MLSALLLAAATAAPANLLLVTIDTLRADHVGAYGFKSGTTPTIDALAREGVLVEEAVVHVPQTRPSHVTLFTGRLPYEHGIRDNFSRPLDPATPTLASLLRQRGYATAAFIGAYPVSRDSGLDQGFSLYDDPFVVTRSVATREDRAERPASEVVDHALEWLKKPKNGPFFAWVHLFDPHAPYEPPPPYAQRFASDPYSGEVAFSDAQAARLLAWLDSAGLRDRTLVVVTSDHGEGLGDHGEDEHMFFVYDSTLRVPLVLRWPGKLPKGARVTGQFREVDLLATLLGLLGLPPVPTSGASRAEVLQAGGRLPDNQSYAESLYAHLHFGCAPLRALRAEGWKYIDAPKAELYGVAEDPGETRNRLADRSQVAAGMRSRLLGFDRGGEAKLPAVDVATQERLAALGYVGGAFFLGQPSGMDPKDKIGEFQGYRREVTRAIRVFRDGDFETSARLFKRLAETATREGGLVVERRSFNVDYYYGRSLLELRRFAEAVGPLTRAVELDPRAAPAHVLLARALAGANRPAEAIAVIERGLRVAPGNAELFQLRGRLLLQRGDLPAARAALEKARALDPKNALVRVDLSSLLRSQGELQAARGEADEAVRLAPDLPEAQVERGLVLGAQGREDLAAEAFKAALARSPQDPDALFFLASVELRAGRAEAALPLLEKLTAKAPDYPGAEQALAAARAASAPPPAGSARLRLLRAHDAPRAEQARARAAAGADFAALARELSEDPSASAGGDLGVVRLADLAEPLRSAAAALSPGQVSPVLTTSNGYVVLKRER